jgi:hypothetical protein
MPLSLKDLLYGGLVPAVVAFVVWFLARLILKENAAARYAPSLALVTGFATGYFLVGLGPWMVKSHYTWLPYVVAATVIVAPLAHASGVSWFERLLLYAVFAVVAAWLLVPDRKEMDPTRLQLLLTWGPGLVLTAFLLDGVIERFRGPLLPGLLTFTAICTAAVLGLSGNLRFAQMIGAGAAALGAITVATLWAKEVSLKGISLPFATLIWGGMLIARMNTSSAVPLASYVIVPVAPLLMWAAVRGPLSRGAGFVAGLKKTALPVIACVVAVAMAAMAEFQ